MKCSQCNAELASGKPECPHCGHVVSEVKVLSRQDRDNFDGVTLGEEERSANGAAYGQYQQEYGGGRIHVKQVSFGGGFLSRLLLGGVLLVLLAFLTLLFFAALPIILFVLSVAGTIFYWLFRRR
ncbi:MAG TPA: hypothetical protein VN611_06055 [Patescibacteria group bacterium]|nr:hypothetical protein [Patescibacteria group bacterium]